MIGSDDGPTSITYTYDPEKLNNASMPGVEEDIASFEKFSTTMEINQDGIPVMFTESGTVMTASGETLSVNIKIDITSINEVFEIPYPVDEIYKPGEKPASSEG